MNKLNPWRGFCSYDGEDSRYPFCGRSKAIRELRDIVDNNLCCTLYGKSGNGKTSLINAGLSPILRNDYYLPIKIRLSQCKNKTYLHYIIEEIKLVSERCECNNKYIEQATSLYSFFKESVFKDKNGKIIFPVLIFDQFEEILIDKNEIKQSDDLLKGIYDIVEPCLNEQVQNVRIMLTIREDDLYLLEDRIDKLGLYALKDERYRLLPITEEEADEIISIPGDGLFQSLDEDMLKDIREMAFNNVTKDYDVLMLSLVCSQLYEFSNGKSHSRITKDDVDEFKKTKALSRFYQTICKDLTEEQILFIESELVSKDNRRDVITYNDFTNNLPDYLLKNNRLNDSDKTETGNNQNIAIFQTVSIDSNPYVELVHDRVAEIIAEQREQRHEEKRIKKKMRTFDIVFGCLVAFVAIFFVILGIFHQFGNKDNLSHKSKTTEKTLRVSTFNTSDTIPNVLMRKDYTSVSVAFFNKKYWSCGNTLYRYDDHGTIICTFPREAKYIISYFGSAIITDSQRDVYFVCPSDSIKLYIWGHTDSCTLHIPYRSMRQLVQNTNIDIHKFYDIREMSLLETGYRTVLFWALNEFHGIIENPLTSESSNITPTKRTLAIVFKVLIMTLIFSVVLTFLKYKKKQANKARLFFRIWIKYILFGVVIDFILYVLSVCYDLNVYFTSLGTLTILFIVFLSEITGLYRSLKLRIYNPSKLAKEKTESKKNIITYDKNKRISIKQYILPYAFYWLTYCIFYYCKIDDPYYNNVRTVVFSSLSICYFVWFYIYPGRKRCHDVNKSGWWQLVPFWNFILLFKKGTVGPNKYGMPQTNLKKKNGFDYDVFVSYSRPNSGAASYIANVMRMYGIKCWYDRDNLSESDFIEQITMAIAKSKVILLIHSELANNSPWVGYDMHLAHNLNKYIIPVKIDNSDYSDELKPILNRISYINYSNDTDGDDIEKIRMAVVEAIKRQE